LVRVPAAHAGKKGKCPHCQAIMQIPTATTKAAASAKSGGQGGAASAKSGGPISFHCPSCSRLVKTPAAAAGKKGKCPHCAAVVQIPTKSTAASPASSGLTPLPESDGLTPLPDSGGLTPLDDPGGFGAGAGLGGGLQPLTGPNDPLGMGLPADDPFAGLGQIPQAGAYGGFGGAAGAADPYAPSNPYGPSNPYAASNPYAVSSAGATPKSRKRSSGGSRKGLPWDRGESGAFFATLKKILFEPVEAYSRMRQDGGLGAPLGFAVLGSLLGAAATSAYQLIFGAIMIVIIMNAGDAENSGAAAAGMMFQMAMQTAGNLVGATVGTVISSFIGAGILHLLLMLFGGANQSFETTYRVVGYTVGAVSCFAVLPVCGGVIVLFAYPVYLIIGATYGHETDGWRSACAVLMPYVLCCVGGVALLFTLFGIIANA
jgi:phage FluMu protein Com